MSELQKNIIENLLKVKRKTKRDLAKLLNIKENSINRTLKNKNISISKLGVIANFLEVNIIDLLPREEQIHDNEEDYSNVDSFEATNQLTISNLSEALKRSSQSIESLVQIIAKKIPEKILS